MKMTSRTQSLNPAFKRFQYLPHLPPGNSGRRGCAAPVISETFAAERSDSLDTQPRRPNITEPQSFPSAADDDFAISS